MRKRIQNHRIFPFTSHNLLKIGIRKINSVSPFRSLRIDFSKSSIKLSCSTWLAQHGYRTTFGQDGLDFTGDVPTAMDFE
jgi:hypothetical protein